MIERIKRISLVCMVAFLGGCVSIPLVSPPNTPTASAEESPADTRPPCRVDPHGWRIRNLSIPYEEQQTDC